MGLNFLFSDRSRHGSSGGNSMGKPHKNATAADREGWKKYDRTGGFRAGRKGRRQSADE